MVEQLELGDAFYIILSGGVSVHGGVVLCQTLNPKHQTQNPEPLTVKPESCCRGVPVLATSSPPGACPCTVRMRALAGGSRCRRCVRLNACVSYLIRGDFTSSHYEFG